MPRDWQKDIQVSSFLANYQVCFWTARWSIYFLFSLDQTGCKKEPTVVSDPLRLPFGNYGATNTLTYGNRYWIGQLNKAAHFVYNLGVLVYNWWTEKMWGICGEKSTFPPHICNILAIKCPPQHFIKKFPTFEVA